VYRRQVRRRRAVLVTLVVACLVLISTHFSEGESGPLHSAQNGVGSVLAPLEEGASRALKPVRDLVNWFDETFEARGENDQLRAENQDLRAQLTATEQRLAEGIERGRVAEITSEPELDAYESVDARVIARSPSTWTQALAIDKGSNAGLEVDDAVITGDGLVGRISSLTGGSARVTLITDQESSVTAKVLKGGPLGVVGPEIGDPDDLILELISGEKEVDPGAELVTAGFASESGNLRSRFPPGIPIGKASESDSGEQELSQQVHVKPYADMAKIEFVSVLTGGPT
jgi:rod shape-determining protein MreC